MTRAAWESPPDSAFSGPALIRLQMRQALNRCPGPRSICHIGNIAIVNVWRIFVGNLPSISVFELFYRLITIMARFLSCRYRIVQRASESRASRARLRTSIAVKAGDRRKLSSRSRLSVTGSAATSSSSQ